VPSTARPPASADAGPYRDAPPVLETVPLDDEARARVEKEISSAISPLIICGMLLTAFLVGLYATHGWLLLAFPLDFIALGLAIGVRVAVREILRASADRRGGMVRGEAEVRWRKTGYKWVLEDGRSFFPEGDAPAFGRYRVVALPRLGVVLRHELVDEATAAEARAAQDEAMDEVLRVTPATLAANEAGRLTARQRRRLALGVLGFVLIVLFFLMIILVRPWSSVIALPLAALFAWLSTDAVRASFGGRTEAIEGEVTTDRLGGKYPKYYLIVEGKRLLTDIMVYRAFRLSGERHRIVTSTNGDVMSVRALP
jgi:hypothetical protein